jgi:hypothetical protein
MAGQVLVFIARAIERFSLWGLLWIPTHVIAALLLIRNGWVTWPRVRLAAVPAQSLLALPLLTAILFGARWMTQSEVHRDVERERRCRHGRVIRGRTNPPVVRGGCQRIEQKRGLPTRGLRYALADDEGREGGIRRDVERIAERYPTRRHAIVDQQLHRLSHTRPVSRSPARPASPKRRRRLASWVNGTRKPTVKCHRPGP